MKKLWQKLSGVLGKGEIQESEELSADDFATFFRDKVEAVRSLHVYTTPPHDVTYKSTPTINEWAEVTADEVEKLILIGSALSKSCQLDPASTWLVKDMRTAVTFCCSAVQQVTEDWLFCFPAAFKLAVIPPSTAEEEWT